MNTLQHRTYTEAEQKKILSSIVVLVDTREQVNGHITAFLDSKNIKHISKKLNSGDYSFMLSAIPELDVPETFFDNEIIIERKASLEELSQNLAQNRDRFENEFLRCNARKFLLIENGSYSDILEGRYRTEMKSNSYFASLLTFQTRHKLETVFIPPKHSGQWIYGTCYYFLREKLKEWNV
jgi:ERCC4-type nuclease